MIDDQEQVDLLNEYQDIVSSVLRIDDFTLGDKKQRFLVRYRGNLRYTDSAGAYELLAQKLRPFDITPLLRWEEDRIAVELVQGSPKPSRSNPWINLILFFVTLLSVGLTGALYGMDGPLPEGLWPSILLIFSRGWPFAISMLSILGAHEFGHYLVGRYHGVNVSLPYFIPLPFSPFGTMGAFINMKEPPKNRRVLLDIGIAGPLAGLVVSIPVLLIGLSLSSVDVLPMMSPEGMTFQLEGNSILYLLAKFAVFGQLLPAPADYGHLGPVLYWVRYFVTGRPFPLGGVDVLLHPVAWAGWAGLLVTAMNLIPAGQLDGGHLLYVLIGRKRAQRIFPMILIFLVIMGLVWPGWWLWAALIFFLGRAYAEPLDQVTPLDERRKLLAVLGLVIFILTFTPVPLSIF